MGGATSWARGIGAVALAAGALGCAQESDRDGLDGAATTTESDGSEPSGPAEGDGGRPEEDGFYPVLLLGPLDTSTDVTECAAGLDAPGASPASSVAIDRDGEICYVLGPGLPMADAVESADAALGETGEWEIQLEFSESGIEHFNDVAAQCHRRDPELCPIGMVAIVAGGSVQSAPTIETSSFERDDIVIAGSFTEDEADALAAVLDG